MNAGSAHRKGGEIAIWAGCVCKRKSEYCVVDCGADPELRNNARLEEQHIVPGAESLLTCVVQKQFTCVGGMANGYRSLEFAVGHC